MKQTIVFVVLLFLMASCVQTPMYNWQDYEKTSYKFLKNGDESSRDNLMETYEKMIKKQNGKRKVVPPGVYADYAFLLLQVDRSAEAKEMLNKEVALYPESKFFVERIIKMME